MRWSRLPAGLAPMLFGGLLVAAWSGAAAASCELHSPGGAITHVVHIQLDNLHLRRDNPNVPSDLEQMPHLLDFLASDGTLGNNHRTSLFAQKATEILTILTGLYGDRMGVPIADSYGIFRSDGSVGFASAFGYWTARGADGKPLMLADTGKTVPAPWVPFTRAGCDVGVFATANMALQDLESDPANVFGATSQEAHAVAADQGRARADLLGIAVHCAHGSPLCNNAHARPDLLPDEPGGYLGFNALFGNSNVQPVISAGGPVKDIVGNIVTDGVGHPGFPDAFEPTAAQSFGYAAALLEAGVPVVYLSVGDAHRDQQASGRASGPGERDYVARLSAYDAAFKAFVDRLAADGMTKRNTLFIVVSAENDSFVGGQPSPPDCDGLKVPCSYPDHGEIDTTINRLLVTARRNVTSFDIQFGSSPPFYIYGNPLATDPLTRTLQQDVDKLTVLNPTTGKTDRLVAMLADRAEMQILHLVTSSAVRSPSFIMFGDPNYFHQTDQSRADCSQAPVCVKTNPRFVWARRDAQLVADASWFGIAGPGVAHLGQTDIVSGHADLRPTMLALVGLADSFVHDGVVLAEVLGSGAPPELAGGGDTYIALSHALKRLDDPRGQIGQNSLALATQAIRGGDAGYQRYLSAIGTITARRDALAREDQDGPRRGSVRAPPHRSGLRPRPGRPGRCPDQRGRGSCRDQHRSGRSAMESRER